MSTPTPDAQTPSRGRLWVTFWVWGVLLSHGLFAAILGLYRHVDTMELALLLAVFLAYTVFILRSIWFESLDVANRYWTQLARALTFAWALNALLVCVFLFLGHIDEVVVPF